MTEKKKETVDESLINHGKRFLNILAADYLTEKITGKTIVQYASESLSGLKDWAKMSTPFTALATAVGVTFTEGKADSLKISDVIKGIQGAVGDQIRRVCPNTACGDETISKEKLGLLALVGIPLAIYLFVQLQGTDEEKENMERKLREARRMTEETSDRRIKRRRTNKLKEFSQTEIPQEMSLSDSKSKSNSTARRRGIKRSIQHRKSARKHK